MIPNRKSAQRKVADFSGKIIGKTKAWSGTTIESMIVSL